MRPHRTSLSLLHARRGGAAAPPSPPRALREPAPRRHSLRLPALHRKSRRGSQRFCHAGVLLRVRLALATSAATLFLPLTPFAGGASASAGSAAPATSAAALFLLRAPSAGGPGARGAKWMRSRPGGTTMTMRRESGRPGAAAARRRAGGAATAALRRSGSGVEEGARQICYPVRRPTSPSRLLPRLPDLEQERELALALATAHLRSPDLEQEREPRRLASPGRRKTRTGDECAVERKQRTSRA